MYEYDALQGAGYLLACRNSNIYIRLDYCICMEIWNVNVGDCNEPVGVVVQEKAAS